MKNAPVINLERCNLCGKCVRDCPREVLAIKDKKVITRDRAECMFCCHCYSICPEDAVLFDTDILKACVFSTFVNDGKQLNADKIDPSAVINAIRSRRSVRKFKDRELSKETLSDLVEFAATAPSGTNMKNWEFTVVNGRGRVSELAGLIRNFYSGLNRMARNPALRLLLDPFVGGKLSKYYKGRLARVDYMLKQNERGRDLFLWNAPAVIVIHSGGVGSTPHEDAQYAAYNILIMAHTLGIGTCFIGYATEALNRDEKIRQFLGIPAGNKVHIVMIAGYSSAEYCRLPLTKKVKVNWI